MTLTNENKSGLDKAIGIFWHITLFFGMWGSALFSVPVPGIGELFPFRVAVCLTALLFLIRCVKQKENPFAGRTAIEKVFFAFLGVMVIYGFVSLAIAIDFSFTFKRLFNLCLDVLFCLLFLFLVRDKKTLKQTFQNLFINLIAIQAVGFLETFTGNLFTELYQDYKRFDFYMLKYLIPPAAGFENTNDYMSSMMFILFILIGPVVLRFLSVEKPKKSAYLKIIALVGVSFYLGSCAFASLGNFSLELLVLGIILVGIMLLRRKLNARRIWFALAGIFVVYAVVWTAPMIRPAKVIISNNKKLAAYEKKVEGMTAEEKSLYPSPVMYPIPKVYGRDMSLFNLIFTTNEDGEIVINKDTSPGIRAELIGFAVGTLIDSKGLGVGLGNTEQLAMREPYESLHGYERIHCFAIRLCSDFGIFVIIPAVWLIVLVLRRYFKLFHLAKKKNDLNARIFYLFILIGIAAFPFLSTAPSDAQDLIAMWSYLCFLIVMCTNPSLMLREEEERQSPPER